MKTLIMLLVSFVLVGTAFSAGLIDISYSPYTISQPGSYIVVADLTPGQDLNAITVNASNVTIDLNGHTLYGAGTATGTSGRGVYAQSSCDNVIVKNGVIRDFREEGIYLRDNAQVTQIRAYTNGGIGIRAAGYSSLIWDNCVYNNYSNGIQVASCSVVRDNSVYNNYGNGISTGMNSVIRDNCLYSNELIGITVGNGNTITGNSVYGSGTTGISGSTGSTVTGNTVYFNKGDGIQVFTSCQVVGNTCRGNYIAGIHTTGSDNAIFQNVVTQNGGAGLQSTSGCYFEQNKLSGNTPDESLGTSTEGAGDLQNVTF